MITACCLWATAGPRPRWNSRPLLFGQLGDLERENLCIAPGAFMAFHAVRGEKYKNYMVAETRAMYETYPPEIRRWIDHNGGWQNLPIDGFWTMYDHSLWALGYPRCAP